MDRVGKQRGQRETSVTEVYFLFVTIRRRYTSQPRIRQIVDSPNRKAERIAWASRENSDAIVAALWFGVNKIHVLHAIDSRYERLREFKRVCERIVANRADSRREAYFSVEK